MLPSHVFGEMQEEWAIRLIIVEVLSQGSNLGHQEMPP